MTCAICAAAEHADPANLSSLVRYQSVQLERAQDHALRLEVDLHAARERITELEHLEDTVARLNRRLMERNRRKPA